MRTKPLLRRWSFLALALVLCSLSPLLAACGADGDPPPDGSIADDDDAGDDDAGDDDSGDDDAGDDDDAGPDPFPELDPAACAWPTVLDPGGFSADYVRLASGSFLQDKNFYLLTLLQESPEARAAIEADPVLSALSADRDARLREAAALCGADAACHADRLLFSENETEVAAQALADALGAEPDAIPLADDHMRPAGDFHLYVDGDDARMVAEALRDAASAMTGIFWSNGGSVGGEVLGQTVAEVSESHPAPLLFFEPLLFVSTALLETDGRDEAARYEPLTEGENRAAIEALADVSWDAYRFSAMLVPGQGPQIDGQALTLIGRMRCDMAAERYAAGLAPVIVVSGGHVHPDRTPFSEAIEMKRYLMEKRGIAERAILVDPYARHTTTNLRNIARLVLRLGLPTEKPVLVTSSVGQTIYIAHLLDQRCRDELGYLPYRVVHQLDANDSCLMVDPASLFVDAGDPLDP